MAFQILGEPSRPRDTAVKVGVPRAQPFSQPLGTLTGAPPHTRLFTVSVAPTATCIVQETRENRFVTLIAPVSNFAIYISGYASVSPTFGMALPAGIPYEISLPGNQSIYAITDAPGIALQLSVQTAAALVGDLERRL